LPDGQPTQAGRLAKDLPLIGLLVGLALATGLARRLMLNWSEPLWLDEIFTGAIAIGSSPATLLDDLLHELGGPVYYALIWAWEKVAGASNVALRLPSLVFAIAAPLLVLRHGHHDQVTRWLWAGLIALWLPGVGFAAEARSYTLLFLLVSGQTILFVRLIDQPSRRAALHWSILSGLAILTHYHAGILVAFQGLAYLAAHRAAALRTWPAALVFIPVAGWMVLHIPLHIRFTAVAWQPLLDPDDAFRNFLHLLLGLGWLGIPVLAMAVLGTAAASIGSARGANPWSRPKPELLAVGTSVAALLLVYGLGFIRPSFSSRYVMAYMPGILLGIALVAGRLGRRWPPVPALLLAYLLFFNMVHLAQDAGERRTSFRSGYSWEEASAHLQAQGVERLIFLWDNPSVIGAYKPLLFRTGSFYFDRARAPVVPDGVLVQGSDATLRAALIAQASTQQARRQRVGVVLLGRPLDLGATEPGWRCRRFGGPEYGSDVYAMACSRAPFVGRASRPADTT
jgi:hypothetical protein